MATAPGGVPIPFLLLFNIWTAYSLVYIAIAFGYFQLVLQSGNIEFINREWARMTSLENLLKAAGYNRYIYEDFANETLNLYRLIQTATLSNDPEGLSSLVNAFNEDSDSIIAYLKVIRTLQIIVLVANVCTDAHQCLDEN